MRWWWLGQNIVARRWGRCWCCLMWWWYSMVFTRIRLIWIVHLGHATVGIVKRLLRIRHRYPVFMVQTEWVICWIDRRWRLILAMALSRKTRQNFRRRIVVHVMMMQMRMIMIIWIIIVGRTCRCHFANLIMFTAVHPNVHHISFQFANTLLFFCVFFLPFEVNFLKNQHFSIALEFLFKKKYFHFNSFIYLL